MVIPSPSIKIIPLHSVNHGLGLSRLEDGVHQEDLGILVLV